MINESKLGNNCSVNQIKEQELVKKLKEADPTALKKWFRCYYPRLMRICTQRVGDHKDAEDIVQETMINSLRQLQLYAQRASLLSWMVSILRHEIADYYRKKYAKKAIHLLPMGDRLLVSPVQDSLAVNEVVRKALQQLPASSQMLLLMKYVDGLKVAQIAKLLGKTFKTVEAELWRSKRFFRQLYLEIDARER